MPWPQRCLELKASIADGLERKPGWTGESESLA